MGPQTDRQTDGGQTVGQLSQQLAQYGRK